MNQNENMQTELNVENPLVSKHSMAHWIFHVLSMIAITTLIVLLALSMQNPSEEGPSSTLEDEEEITEDLAVEDTKNEDEDSVVDRIGSDPQVILDGQLDLSVSCDNPDNAPQLTDSSKELFRSVITDESTFAISGADFTINQGLGSDDFLIKIQADSFECLPFVLQARQAIVEDSLLVYQEVSEGDSGFIGHIALSFEDGSLVEREPDGDYERWFFVESDTGRYLLLTDPHPLDGTHVEIHNLYAYDVYLDEVETIATLNAGETLNAGAGALSNQFDVTLENGIVTYAVYDFSLVDPDDFESKDLAFIEYRTVSVE